jgi:hypothetical protein
MTEQSAGGSSCAEGARRWDLLYARSWKGVKGSSVLLWKQQSAWCRVQGESKLVGALCT